MEAWLKPDGVWHPMLQHNKVLLVYLAITSTSSKSVAICFGTRHLADVSGKHMPTQQPELMTAPCFTPFTVLHHCAKNVTQCSSL